MADARGAAVAAARRRRRAGAGAVDAQVTATLDALRRIVRALRAAAQGAERRLGISGAQLFVLERLAEAAAPSLNDLAERTHTHKSSVSVVVSRLVARRLVRRRRADGDRRGVELAITAAGRAALRRAPRSAQTRLVEALRRLRPAERAGLVAGLERFTAELGIRGLKPTMLFEEEREERR